MAALNKSRLINSIALTVAGVVSCVMVGCKNNEPQPVDSSTSYDINDQTIVETSSVTRYDPSSPEQSRRLDLQIQPSENRPILQGKLPMVYLIDSDSTVMVVDQNGNAIANVEAKSGWVLTVNDRGVFLGQKKIGTVTDASGVYSIQLVQPPEAPNPKTVEQAPPLDGHPSQ